MALYFPRLNIQCNEWKQWMDWAANVDYNVMIVPLKEEYRKKMNLAKAWKRYEELDDIPYGI